MAQPASRGMSESFDVLVRSVDALNASMRMLSQDLQRAFNAQQTFTPGGTQQNRPTPPPGQPSGQPPSQPRQVNPQAGQTNRFSLARSAQSVWQTFTAGQTQSQPQQPGQPAPVPPPAQPGGPAGPMGPHGPWGGGPGGPGGPHGPGGPAHGGGMPWWGGGHYYGHQGGQGGGWTNMAISQARRVPYVGAAITGAASVSNLYLSEREKNRFYQGMEGGSNVAGFAERAHEEIYRWSLGPAMSGDMARRSFKGVTSMGYTGKSQTLQGRQEALDFVYHNYNARGMDVEESLNILQTASHDATVNFTELSEALKEVSDTAGKAGVNAKFMRQQYQGMLQASIGQGAGPGAAEIAGALTSAQASYGREFQGQDFRGQLSRQYQYMLGAQYGISPGQLQGIMRNQPQQYTRMVAGSQREWINTVFSPQQIATIQALIKKYGSSQSAVSQIEQEFLNAHPEIDLHVIADTLSGDLTGVQLDESNVIDWVIQQLAGNTAAAHGQQQRTRKPVDIQGSPELGRVKPGQDAPRGKYGLVDPETMIKSGTTSPGEFLSHVNAGKEFLGLFGQEENKAGEAYAKWMEKTKKRDPVLEAILQNVKDPNSTKVRVSTASGDRIVSFEEAMKYFPNELAAGKVQIVTGDQAGKTMSQIIGGNADPERDVRGELTGKTQQRLGQSVEEYEKKHGRLKGSESPAAGKVTVDLTEEAKRLLQLLPSTNNQANSTGYPAFNPHAQQGSRP